MTPKKENLVVSFVTNLGIKILQELSSELAAFTKILKKLNAKKKNF